jgi:signal transduction histidine kinase
MLTIARADHRVDDPASVSPADIARRGWTTVGPDGAELALDIPEEWRIEASASLLQTLFENLFRNAIDHNDPPVTVTVGLLDGSQSGLFVADDGTGIPADRQETVFEHGVSTGGDGAGIGLAIVAEIVDSHGWDITVTASETGGTRFEIRT